jgi:tetrapyrrole methylase family protein/MazG family protein
MWFERGRSYSFADLIEIMKVLRSECHWDKSQTHKSIRKNVIEEAYEVADAIDRCDNADLCEELGDLLLQVVFHSQIASEDGSFSFDEVADGICKKLILRHPHIFSDTTAKDAEEVLDNWDSIKRQEKGFTNISQTLESVPKNLPALMRSQKVQKRASKAGFDFESLSDVICSLEKEISELKEAISSKDDRASISEMGDVLFSCVNLARHLKIDAEECLTFSCEKFISRFNSLEKQILKSNASFENMTGEKLDAIWNDIKRTNISE